MKDNKYLTSYEFFKTIDHDSELSRLVNMAFGKLLLARLVSAPQTYPRDDKWTDEEMMSRARQVGMFYNLCLGELYLHSIFINLTRWTELANKYNTEFEGSWKFYATSKRMESIKEYGGEDHDYNSDGTIRTLTTNTELEGYSVIGDLIHDDWRDIFLQTKPFDLYTIYTGIALQAEISIPDMFKSVTDKEIKSYRQTEDGKMIENTWADEVMIKAEGQLAAEQIINMLYSAVCAVCGLIEEVRSLNKADDNKAFFLSLPGRIQNIFNLKIKMKQMDL
jgi:hypothetical protein